MSGDHLAASVFKKVKKPEMLSKLMFIIKILYTVLGIILHETQETLKYRKCFG